MAFTEKKSAVREGVLSDLPQPPDNLFLKPNGQPDIDRQAAHAKWWRDLQESLLDKLEKLNQKIDKR